MSQPMPTIPAELRAKYPNAKYAPIAGCLICGGVGEKMVRGRMLGCACIFLTVGDIDDILGHFGVYQWLLAPDAADGGQADG